MKHNAIVFLCFILLFTWPAGVTASDKLSLSLHQREEKGEVVLDILVVNVSVSSVLWATIPLRSLKHVILNESGQKELRSIIQDASRHIIAILPNDRWKDIDVGSGKLEIAKSARI